MLAHHCHSAIGGKLILLAALGALAARPVLAMETYDIDKVHSAVNFKVRHLFGQVPGQFTDFGGVLQYDPAKPENSQIEITIQTSSIDTNNQMRDNHLRSQDFLFAEKYPTITFKSTKVEPATGQNKYKVTGDLTIRGVTKAVAVDVELLGFGEVSGMGYRGGFTASAVINRLDFGVMWNKTLDAGGTLLGNEIYIDFPIEVVRK